MLASRLSPLPRAAGCALRSAAVCPSRSTTPCRSRLICILPPLRKERRTSIFSSRDHTQSMRLKTSIADSEPVETRAVDLPSCTLLAKRFFEARLPLDQLGLAARTPLESGNQQLQSGCGLISTRCQKPIQLHVRTPNGSLGIGFQNPNIRWALVQGSSQLRNCIWIFCRFGENMNERIEWR